MRVSSQASNPRMECVVLCVYRPSRVTVKSALLDTMAASYSYQDDWAWRNLEFGVYEDPIPLKFALRPKHAYDVCPTPGSANVQVEQEWQKKIAKAKAEALRMVDRRFLSRPSLRPKNTKLDSNLSRNSSQRKPW
ncbi:hypothetical protein CPB86DRAFT_820121 [Serendipita vermifera]|nr:hypothetical protein CPB86DRAFT_820121 [Serendipita vermifera]